MNNLYQQPVPVVVNPDSSPTYSEPTYDYYETTQTPWGALIGLVTAVLLVLSMISPVLAGRQNISASNIILMTNEERNKHDLGPLKLNPDLQVAAHAKALAILNTGDSNYTLNGESFSAWIRESDYDYVLTGENLGEGYSSSKSLIKAWMSSPSHRHNILNSQYQDIGIAVIEGNLNGRSTEIVVQIFGDPAG